MVNGTQISLTELLMRGFPKYFLSLLSSLGSLVLQLSLNRSSGRVNPTVQTIDYFKNGRTSLQLGFEECL